MASFSWAGISQVAHLCHRPQGQASLWCPLIAITPRGQESLWCPLTATSPKDRRHSSIPSLPSSLGTDIVPVPPHCHLCQGAGITSASPPCHHPWGQTSLQCPLTATSPKDRHHSGVPSLPSSLRTGITPVLLHYHLPQGPASLPYPPTATPPKDRNHSSALSLPPPLRSGTGQHKTHLFFPHIKLFTQQLFQSFAIAKPHGVPNHRDHKTKNPPPPPTPKGLLNADFQQRRKPPNNPLPRRSRQPPPTSRAPGSAHSRSSVLTYIFVPR